MWGECLLSSVWSVFERLQTQREAALVSAILANSPPVSRLWSCVIIFHWLASLHNSIYVYTGTSNCRKLRLLIMVSNPSFWIWKVYQPGISCFSLFHFCSIDTGAFIQEVLDMGLSSSTDALVRGADVWGAAIGVQFTYWLPSPSGKQITCQHYEFRNRDQESQVACWLVWCVSIYSQKSQLWQASSSWSWWWCESIPVLKGLIFCIQIWTFNFWENYLARCITSHANAGGNSNDISLTVNC